MASSLFKNAIQIYFDSVFGMADEGMVKMFKTIESSGLLGFLGCSYAIYEAALLEFFPNASVRDDKVVSTVQGKEMKFEFRLLNDILAKTVKVKAGSFDAVTHERFMMMSAIHGGVKEVQDQQAALSNDMMEFRVQAKENFNTLTVKLSELVAYINRGGDAKKGEMSSSRGPPPPDDQNRPDGGSRSQPQRKRGGGSQSSSRQRGFRYWLGGD
ncbi:cysteine-rich receptor-like protein kinase 2 [Dorcoceras hygrometricum]|uniref:Cysteine-rich receptor-like protein kinase 2 n=1 Tax=Dorcoceras hygrometricum TaxID=472368 RepID=A0A2Z7AUC0_9LAMI|nr:cysteine-rich receptor-like protein kinase 2 [Dorcoceras hygrometricum]